MRTSKAGVAICIALLVSLIMGASFAGAAGPVSESNTPEANIPEAETDGSLGCFSNEICTYFGEYDSFVGTYECSWSGTWKYWPAYTSSAKNRCGNKTNWLRWNGNVIACMNPGGNRPNPGNFNELFIAKEYGAWC